MAPPRKLELKQYFTDAEHINALMCHLLGPVDGLRLLEPSVGHGALLKGLEGRPASIDAIDVDDAALDVVRSVLPAKDVTLHHCDFIDIATGALLSERHPALKKSYDAVISNPPYGLPLSIEHRRQLKKQFPHLYVKESYGLFFVFAVSQLKPGGRYVFLIPDTFLTSKNHTPLREFMCREAAPTHIIRFPSKMFETVNFGYGNLCIVAGIRSPLQAHSEILWVDAKNPGRDSFTSSEEETNQLTGQALLDKVKSGWSVSHFDAADLFPDWPTLGALAECRTGIYTGDNVRFIGFDPLRVKRRVNGHPIDWNEVVHTGALMANEKVEGLEGSACYVPLVRGGHRDCFETPASAIDWSQDAIRFYKTDKKARFQNASFYFEEGISVPMVSTGRISAALMRDAVFDQGVVGIFPRERRWLAALLIYLNSDLASKLMKGLVNGSANNSANYLKKLPVPNFTDNQLRQAADIVEMARASATLSNEMCNAFIGAVLTSPDSLSDWLADALDNRGTHATSPAASR